ncbi:hypothetical protein FRC03_011823 [Tulasnella sp. 419]|nr:hypothetical protein FRC03_011823 [Tulasnella sp. 419]
MSIVATPRRVPLADCQAPWMSVLPPPPTDIKSPTPRVSSKMRGLGRSAALPMPLPPQTNRVASSKRTRDEEPDQSQLPHVKAKRTRTTTGLPAADARPRTPPPVIQTTQTTKTKEKESKRSHRPTKADRLERERVIVDFKEKYTRAFPNFTFYFDSLDAALKKTLTAKVIQLGARVDNFFSSNVTHVITNRARPPADRIDRVIVGKENVGVSSSRNLSGRGPIGPLRSPIKLRSLGKDSVKDIEAPNYDTLVVKALQFGMKVWDSNKLDTILARLLSSPVRPPPPRNTQNLSNLLAAEKLHGVTNERDPTSRRHDYEYFPKSTYFVLIQDMDERQAPVAVKDYGRWKKGDKPGWPVLNLDGVGSSNGKAPVFGWRRGMDGTVPPKSKPRSPTETQDSTATSVIQKKKGPDLRRAVSMHNLGRKTAQSTSTRCQELSTKPTDMASKPSMASQAYIAASGNSANITSNTGSTTSTAGLPTNSIALLHASSKLASGIRLHQQVLTSRTFGVGKNNTSNNNGDDILLDDEDDGRQGQENDPPARPHLLRKSKSTNTIRLPPREENKKPGYCENCRYKFDDFSKHIKTNRHIKFANNPQHFFSLDEVLSRVRRKTLEEARWRADGVYDGEIEEDDQMPNQDQDYGMASSDYDEHTIQEDME